MRATVISGPNTIRSSVPAQSDIETGTAPVEVVYAFPDLGCTLSAQSFAPASLVAQGFLFLF